MKVWAIEYEDGSEYDFQTMCLTTTVAKIDDFLNQTKTQKGILCVLHEVDELNIVRGVLYTSGVFHMGEWSAVKNKLQLAHQLNLE